ncbi:hypothetical protein GTY54_23475 [Streptomyces sp. SID625]|nr:hypothetical protein [Streptomyces sp. SID625]
MELLTDGSPGIHEAFLTLGCALVRWRRLRALPATVPACAGSAPDVYVGPVGYRTGTGK